ncbi:MAG: PHP domain-containing protein [Aquificaceae bacterium]|nr:PHP domain-containing protein [Aquificaceae bacterium]
MIFIVLMLILFILYLLFVELYPVKRIKVKPSEGSLQSIPDLYVYAFQIHLHSQFSYDSLGKPEDIIRKAEQENIDYVIVTDHDTDAIKNFAGDRLIAGVEKKVLGEGGAILGDLLEVEDLKVVAHPFKKRYRWKLELPKEYLFELIDLKDAILERKTLLLFLLPSLVLKAFFSKKLALQSLKKMLKPERYAKLYLRMNIENQVVGGLDHHVKVYVREVGVRFLFPDYSDSFRLLRNFLLTSTKVVNKEEFPRALKKGMTVISFEEKPTIYWKEEGFLKILPPYKCLLLQVGKESEAWYKGSFFQIKPEKGISFFIGYTYSFELVGLYFGLKPIFVIRWKEA